MSLLGNLIGQVASQALNPNNQQSAPNRSVQQQDSGLGSILGSVLGGNSAQSSGGMGSILGNALGGSMGGNSSGGLGSILGSVLGGGNRAGGGGKAMLVAALMPVVLSWIQRNGGLSGALSKIQNMGHSNQVQSWMSTTQSNEILDPNEVTNIFDEQEIKQVAAQTGTDETEVRQGLAELLPEVVNQLTPKGGLEHEQEADQEINDILQQISGAFGK